MRAVVILISLFVTSAFSGEFDSPWKDAKTALIIDPYYANIINWDRLATEPRVVAIIHKATVGTARVDPGYAKRKEEALKRGYLWGSYHWGVAGHPVEQADFYIDTVKPGADELIALDLEDARSTKLMDVDEAILFINRVKEKTGRYPVLYTNHDSAKLISDKYQNKGFENTPLWYARFLQRVVNFPVGVWKTYALWQFSSEISQPIRIPGTQKDMDINVFNGSIDQLKTAWPLTKATP